MAKIDQLDYYGLLGVTEEATHDEIQRAFHAFARKYHPDAHREDEALHARYVAVYRRGTEAYRVLRSPPARTAYDAGLREGKLRFDGTLTRTARNSVPPSAVQAALDALRIKPPRLS